MQLNLSEKLIAFIMVISCPIAQAESFIKKTPHRIDFNNMIHENDHQISQLRKGEEKAGDQGVVAEAQAKPKDVATRKLSSEKKQHVVKVELASAAGEP